MRKKKLEIGKQGYLAYCDTHVLRVEFVGYDAYEPDYPSEPTRYYRALEPLRLDWKDIEIGNIVDESGPQDEVLYETREEADAAAEKERQYWIRRKEEELAKLKGQK